MPDLNILHFVDSMDPIHGGPPSAVGSIAATQAVRGHDVTVACRINPALDPASAAPFGHIPAIERIRWANYAFDYRRALVSPVRILEQVDPAARADIIHVHGLWRPELLRVCSESRSRNIPYIVSAHGMLSPWSLAQKAWKKRLALKLGWRRAIDKAAVVQALNEDEASYISRLAFRAPVRVFPNGVFLEHNLTESVDMFPELKDGRRFILFLGRLHPGKGVDLLVRGFSQIVDRFPDLDLVIVGPDAGAGESTAALVEHLQLGSRVFFLGGIYGERKAQLAARAVCLCHPSHQEGCSMSVLEVMAEGTPVVISPACHMPEVAEAGAGLIADLDPDAIAVALDRMVADQGYRDSCAAGARKLVHDHYQWTMIVDRMLDLYAEVLAA